MTSKWNILAPMDLSRPTEEDVHHARRLASALWANLHLLYVAESDSPDATTADWPANAFTPTESANAVRRAVLRGPTAQTIAKHAESIDANLILMTSRRFGHWSRFWRKSVADQVMKLSRHPVCIVSGNEPANAPTSCHPRVLCAMGLDGKESKLLQYAEELALQLGADLILHYVVPEPDEALLHHGATGGSRPLSRPVATRMLAEIASGLRPPTSTSVMIGQPDKCIAMAARDHAVDLVLMSRSRAGLPAAYGHDLEQIMAKLPCPLLTVPTDRRATVRRIDEGRDRKPRSLTGRAKLVLVKNVLKKNCVGGTS